MTTGEKIQYYRKKLSLSQEELGQKLLVSRQTVSLWENGQTAPTIDNLVRLKEIFGVSVDELLGCETEAAEDKSESDPDIPVPSESYSVSYSSEEMKTIYKYLTKVSFKKPLISISILTAILITYIWIDMNGIVIGIVAGILFLFVLLNFSSYKIHQKQWKKSVERVLASRYEYRVYTDRFTVDIFRNESAVRTETIDFSDIQKVYDLNSEDYLLLSINNQLYILRKNELAQNSVFYSAIYNSTKLPDKKAAKKLIDAANIFFALSVVVFSLFFFIRFEDFTDKYIWLPCLGLPVTVTCTVLGFVLKGKGFKNKRNILAGIFSTAYLLLLFFVHWFVSDFIEIESDPIAAFTEVTRIALPEEVIDSHTVEYTAGTQPTDEGFIYSTTKAIFEENSVYAFENSLDHDPRWLDEFPKELEVWLYPLSFDESHFTADKMMLINDYTGEYNTVPDADGEDGYCDLTAAFYNCEANRLELFSYTFVPTFEFDEEYTDN